MSTASAVCLPLLFFLGAIFFAAAARSCGTGCAGLPIVTQERRDTEKFRGGQEFPSLRRKVFGLLVSDSATQEKSPLRGASLKRRVKFFGEACTSLAVNVSSFLLSSWLPF